MSHMQPLLTIMDVCDTLGVHENTVYKAIQSGKLKAFRLGGSNGNYRVTESALVEYLSGDGPDRDDQ